MTIDKNISGYTLIEMLLAVVVGAVVLGAAYSSYNVVGNQFNKSSTQSEIDEMAIPTLRILERDFKMAGYRAVDANIESTYAKIDSPLVITDSGTSTCCDSVSIVYDKALDERYRINYYIAARTGLNRNALFMTKDRWTGTVWQNQYTGILVADYIEDMQLKAEDVNSSSQPSLLSINLIFRSKTKTKTLNAFTKNSSSTGNYNFTATDNYLRKEFETTIRIRNLED